MEPRCISNDSDTRSLPRLETGAVYISFFFLSRVARSTYISSVISLIVRPIELASSDFIAFSPLPCESIRSCFSCNFSYVICLHDCTTPTRTDIVEHRGNFFLRERWKLHVTFRFLPARINPFKVICITSRRRA